MNLEEKAKFFAQYFGQEVLKYYSAFGGLIPHYLEVSAEELSQMHFHVDSFLELTPLSQISDEDATILGFNSKQEFIENHSYGDSLEQFELDHLRSKGYALPWLGISVEEQIKRGWIKLKAN